MKIITNSEKETIKFAEKFSRSLKGGEVLALFGDLGSGKTAFTKGLARGLGVKNIITSPTFVLMKNYKTSAQAPIKTLTHIDAYCLKSGEDLEAIGAMEFFNDKKCITAIEWADNIKSIIPKNAIKIYFQIGENNKRQIEIKKPPVALR